jgi:uncharacterized protein HemX
MNRMGKRVTRMLLSSMKSSQTGRITNDVLELLGMRRRRRNGSTLTTILGAGALFYGVKKMMDSNQQQSGEAKHKQPERSTPTSQSPERKSAIQNIVNSYSKTDPGLRTALQEISAELGGNEILKKESENDNHKPDDWTRNS